MGAKTTAVGPAQGLQRQIQQDILAQQPGQIQAIVLHGVDVHLGGAKFNLLVAKGFSGFRIQNRKRIRDGNRNRL